MGTRKKQLKAEKKLDREEERRTTRKSKESPPPSIACQFRDCTASLDFRDGYYNHLSAAHKDLCTVCGNKKCFKVFYTRHEEEDHVKETGHAQAKPPEEMLKMLKKR